MPQLNQVLRGIKMREASEGEASNSRPRLPITPETLRKIKAAWEQEGVNHGRIMLWAAFTLCLFAFMCSGEICCAGGGSFNQTRDLTPQDVTVDCITNPQMLRVHLKHSKTDPFREGTDIFVARTNDELCPVTALLTRLVERGKKEGPLFQFHSGASLTHGTFVACFRKALVLAHIDPKGFSGHSFRIRATTTAAKRGLSDSNIKQLGRWKSSAYQRYIRPTTTVLATLAGSSLSTVQSTSLERENVTH